METFVSLAIPVKQQFIFFRFGASNTSARFVSFRWGGAQSFGVELRISDPLEA